MFTNSIKLMKFMLKREKISSTAWVLGMVISNALIALLLGFAMLPTPADRQEMITMLENPAMLAMVGPIYTGNLPAGVAAYDSGALYTLFMLVFMAVTVGIMNIFLIVRHTRADEEAGRYEVLRSLPSGRLASVNAAMLTAVVVNFVMALGFALTMWLVMGLTDEAQGLAAALNWGFNLGAVGLVFAAVAAMFSQLSSNSRGALGYSFAVLGLFYFLRAGADMNPGEMEVLAYISPFGLMSRTWPYIHNSWGLIAANIGIAGVFTAVAYWLCSIRDIDQGLIPARPGKAYGGRLLRSTFGLNFRLLRLSIIVWISVLFITGFSYSTILEDIENFIAGNDMYRNLMLGPTGIDFDFEGMTTEQIAEVLNTILSAAGLSIVQLFANMTGFVMAMIALVPVLMFILKAKGEEKHIRAELLFATPASKTGYLCGFIALAFVTAIFVQAAQAFGLWSLSQGLLPNPEDLPLSFVMQSAMAYVPAMWIMGGITPLLVGLAPGKTGVIWGYFGFSFFLMLFGRLDMFPSWLIRLTPLGWVPQLPVDEMNYILLAGMALVGLVLAGLGVWFYNQRDINAISH